MLGGDDIEPLKAGDHFGDYVVERLLGSGAMGAVYLVRAPDDSLFAVKIMFPSKMTHDLRSRFAREADFAMKIRHKNLISVYDVGEDPETGLCYIIMDYVPGGTLSDRIKAQGKIPVDEAVRITMQIAAGLDIAHKNGLVHRDVKPDNIMFDADGTPKLADLGVAKFDDDRKTMVTMTGMVIGTPAYMSPEQLMDSHRIDARADIYSLGIVLYEMLSGKRPNSNSTAVELLAKAIKGEPLPDIRKMCPEISASIAHVLSLMCAPKPDDRPSTSIEAANLLHKASIGRLVLPKKPPKSAAEIIDEKTAKRKRAIAVWMVVAGLLTFLVVGLAGIAYAVLWCYSKDPAHPQSTVTERVEPSKPVEPMVVTNVVEKVAVVTNVVEMVSVVTNAEHAAAVQSIMGASNTVRVANENTPQSQSTKQSKSTRKGETDRRVRYSKVDGITWYYTLEDGDAVVWRGQNGWNSETRPALDPSNMEHVVIPSEIGGHRVSAIGSLAFFRCQMKSVVIPEGVRRIAGWAFYDCNRLEDVSLPSTLETLARSPFSGCKSLTSLDIGNCSDFSGLAFSYCSISHVSVSESNPSCRVVGDCLYSRDMRKLIFSPRTGSSAIFPESVEEIGDGAFATCNMLKEVKIGNHVIKIGASAFSMCRQLVEIELPPGLQEIGNNAFAWTALRTITFPSNVTKIGTSLFDRCRSLRTVEFLGDAPKIDTSRTSVLGSVPEDLEIVVRKGTTGWKEANATELPDRWPDGGFADSRKIRFADKITPPSDDKNKHEAEKPQDRKRTAGTSTPLDLSFLQIVTPKGKEGLSNYVHRVVKKLIKDLDSGMGNSLLSGLKGKRLQIVLCDKKSPRTASDYKDSFHLYGISGHEDVFYVAMWLMDKVTCGGWGPRQTGETTIYPTVEGTLFQEVADDVVPNILGYSAGQYQRYNSPQNDLDVVLKYDPQMNQYDFNGNPISKQSSRKIAKQLSGRFPQAKIKWVINELSRTHDAIVANYFRARHEARLAGLLDVNKPLSLDDLAALMSIAAQENLFSWFSDHGMRVSPEKTKIKVAEAVQTTETPKATNVKTILVFPNADIKSNKWKTRTPWRYTTKWPNASKWFTLEFDDGKWNQTRKPIGIGKEKDLMRIADKLKSNDRSVWLRRHFDWKSAKVRKVIFHMIYDSKIIMYLNGEKILDRDGSNTWWQSFYVSIEKFQNAVREGDNVLAVYVNGQISLYFDCGMTVEVEDKNE